MNDDDDVDRNDKAHHFFIGIVEKDLTTVNWVCVCVLIKKKLVIYEVQK